MLKLTGCAWKRGLPHALLGLALLFCVDQAIAETPDQFARKFADFKFEFHTEVQDPATFLASKKGDCDDFATLADQVLTEAGYTTHLITVRMPGENHVVCYVEETGTYLDFNRRRKSKPGVRTDGVLTNIAAQVAASFGKPWLAAYEFTFADKMKRLVAHIVPNHAYLASVTDAHSHIAAAGRGN